MIVDLSVVVDAATLGPPAAGSAPVVLETTFRGPGHWRSSRIAALLHTGSHVDAPLHVVADGRPIDRIALEELSGETFVIDVHDAGERERIDADLLARAAREIPPRAIVAVRTDWTDRRWGTFPDDYTRSPFLTEDAGAWLAALRPRAVVVDFFEEECAVRTEFTSEEFVVHRALLGRDIPIVEQATRLGAVGPDPFLLYTAFVRLAGVEATPVPPLRGRPVLLNRRDRSVGRLRGDVVDLDQPIGMRESGDEHQRGGGAVTPEELLADRAGRREIVPVHEQHRELHDVGDPHAGAGEDPFDVAPGQAALFLDALADPPVRVDAGLSGPEHEPRGSVHLDPVRVAPERTRDACRVERAHLPSLPGAGRHLSPVSLRDRERSHP